MTTMTYLPTKEEEQDSVIPSSIYRLSVAQYHAMIDAGVFTEDDPIELLEGWLVTKMPKNPPHSHATRLLREALQARLPEGLFLDSQEPITTADSEPEPDITIVRGLIQDYATHHPKPENVVMVAEVADATLKQDRTVKKRLYAGAGIPVYWIVNLVNNQIEVYTEPMGIGSKATYRQQQVYRVADEVPVVVDGRSLTTIPAKEILP